MNGDIRADWLSSQNLWEPASAKATAGEVKFNNK